ncbi:hypothetical protein GCM10009733_081710 [Nonomuraea maheshkhaliensis]|uniref:Tetracycline repressor TetR C-terminal domain-containing protein n=2 Tax=Nonomuraea maheshkhaliensis TaxID=419590 RepID=A0ABP4SM52_9ACTN
MRTPVERGFALRQARLIVLTVERFTIGFVLEEQWPRPGGGEEVDLAAYREMFPTVMAGVTDYLQRGRTVDDLFHGCLRMVVEGPPAAPDPAP